MVIPDQGYFLAAAPSRRTERKARETTLTGCIGFSGQENSVGFDGDRPMTRAISEDGATVIVEIQKIGRIGRGQTQIRIVSSGRSPSANS
jgi:hypothetical protein